MMATHVCERLSGGTYHLTYSAPSISVHRCSDTYVRCVARLCVMLTKRNVWMPKCSLPVPLSIYTSLYTHLSCVISWSPALGLAPRTTEHSVRCSLTGTQSTVPVGYRYHDRLQPDRGRAACTHNPQARSFLHLRSTCNLMRMRDPSLWEAGIPHTGTRVTSSG